MTTVMTTVMTTLMTTPPTATPVTTLVTAIPLTVVPDRVVGPVVKASVPTTADWGSIPAVAVYLFSGWSHTRDLNIGAPRLPCQAPGVNGVSAGTGWPGVSILSLGKTESLSCNLAAHATKQIRPGDKPACCWDLKQQQQQQQQHQRRRRRRQQQQRRLQQQQRLWYLRRLQIRHNIKQVTQAHVNGLHNSDDVGIGERST